MAPATGGRARRACHPRSGEAFSTAGRSRRGVVVRLRGQRAGRHCARDADRDRAAAAPTADRRSEASAATPRPGLRLRRVGTFDSPVYVTSPPGDRRRLFVVEQGGAVRVMRDGRTLVAPVPRPPGPDLGGRRARPAVARVRARLRAQRPLLRLLHGPRRRDPDRRVPAPQRRARAARVGAGRPVAAASGGQPQRRAGAVRAGRDALRRARRRGRRRRPGQQRPEPRHGPGEDHPHRSPPAGRARLPRAQLEPVRGALGRAPRDLRVRAAQPVAVRVHAVGRPRRRRRRAERGRGGLDRAPRGRQPRLARLRGPQPLHRRARPRAICRR